LRWLEQTVIAIDQLANAIIGGMADETLSARSHRNKHKTGWNRFRKVLNLMFFWQEDHAAEAFASEKNRRHLPYEYRR